MPVKVRIPMHPTQSVAAARRTAMATRRRTSSIWRVTNLSERFRSWRPL
jgi:hypothetical protein